eukprot:GHVN01035706.1.p1 GENE.GHVN01035706.1~~GHVN01035706.1.p1  ORF type:complete len:1168 (+),score=99.69 GHVN01035706.1:4187-7690(+)
MKSEMHSLTRQLLDGIKDVKIKDGARTAVQNSSNYFNYDCRAPVLAELGALLRTKKIKAEISMLKIPECALRLLLWLLKIYGGNMERDDKEKANICHMLDYLLVQTAHFGEQERHNLGWVLVALLKNRPCSKLPRFCEDRFVQATYYLGIQSPPLSQIHWDRSLQISNSFWRPLMDLVSEIQLSRNRGWGFAVTFGDFSKIATQNLKSPAYLYGSNASGFAMSSSDLDIVILLTPESEADLMTSFRNKAANGDDDVNPFPETKPRHVNESQNKDWLWLSEKNASSICAVRKLAAELVKHFPIDSSHIECIERTRVPIIRLQTKFYYLDDNSRCRTVFSSLEWKPIGSCGKKVTLLNLAGERRDADWEWVSIDISFSHEIVIHNTRLMRTYSALDPLVSPLGLLIKYWAKQRGINQTMHQTFSGYQWMLIMIHYIQYACAHQPGGSFKPILPNLQCDSFGSESLNNPDSISSDGHNVSFYHPTFGWNKKLTGHSLLPRMSKPSQQGAHSNQGKMFNQEIKDWPEDELMDGTEYAAYLLWGSDPTKSMEQQEVSRIFETKFPSGTRKDHLFTLAHKSLFHLFQGFFTYLAFHFNFYSHVFSVNRAPEPPATKREFFNAPHKVQPRWSDSASGAPPPIHVARVLSSIERGERPEDDEHNRDDTESTETPEGTRFSSTLGLPSDEEEYVETLECMGAVEVDDEENGDGEIDGDWIEEAYLGRRCPQYLRKSLFMCISDPFEDDRVIGCNSGRVQSQLSFEIIRAHKILWTAAYHRGPGRELVDRLMSPEYLRYPGKTTPHGGKREIKRNIPPPETTMNQSPSPVPLPMMAPAPPAQSRPDFNLRALLPTPPPRPPPRPTPSYPLSVPPPPIVKRQVIGTNTKQVGRNSMRQSPQIGKRTSVADVPLQMSARVVAPNGSNVPLPQRFLETSARVGQESDSLDAEITEPSQLSSNSGPKGPAKRKKAKRNRRNPTEASSSSSPEKKRGSPTNFPTTNPDTPPAAIARGSQRATPAPLQEGRTTSGNPSHQGNQSENGGATSSNNSISPTHLSQAAHAVQARGQEAMEYSSNSQRHVDGLRSSSDWHSRTVQMLFEKAEQDQKSVRPEQQRWRGGTTTPQHYNKGRNQGGRPEIPSQTEWSQRGLLGVGPTSTSTGGAYNSHPSNAHLNGRRGV